MPNTAFFKRIFSIASTILTCINIWTTKEFSGKDLTIVMFIISNLLTVFGVEFNSKSNTKNMQNIRKLCSGFLIIFSFVLVFDEGKNITRIVSPVIINIVYSIVTVGTCLYCIFLSIHLTTHDDLNKSLATSINTTFNIINEEAINLRDDIERNGGWIEFLKTDIGRQFAEAIKVNTRPKVPKDHLKKHKRRRRRK
ncbi:hypothetical protein [Lactobacillus crispatus]|uniref:Uncharacterized protein n=1 Tax=Lactobacillus crispatus TaxID=47770 RepID=A0AB73BQ25_9LACO|nr:hypothetical protein [Lactobacillus crispatus]KAA8791819.1 hypothetical protein F1B99_09545 [Lactobacillus crispatus]KAA8795948.1 hypothetical protein F1B96_08615 [Lactobacillus crispatus]KAA8798141.1 hypothetical protein F1C02_05150 [Lactobacillus crispatus]KAA8800062.1 hypothetical protein F1C04_10765 [Lactobacillus crispatus]KAA8800068.1 hypothetical protein F1C03_09280 [Lactobacillus crispatus]